MAISKIILNGVTQMDVTDTTAVAESVTAPAVFYSSNGTRTIGTGTGGQSGDDVVFIDYDGTEIARYDIASLSALPSNPSHEGLTAQGWNWTLAQINAQHTAYPDQTIYVGQLYVTDDGKTRLYCRFDGFLRSPYLGVCVNGTVVVDWGDNTATDTLTGSSLSSVKNVQHTYASDGDYIITIAVSSGSFAILGTAQGANIIKKTASVSPGTSKAYASTLKKVEFGSNVRISDYAFYDCKCLESVTMTSSLTSTTIGQYAFCGCLPLKSLTIPSGVTSINTYFAARTYCLKKISIPSTVTNINGYAFNNCTHLEDITLPSGLKTIGEQAFRSCVTLGNISLPSTLTSIGQYALSYFPRLVNATVPGGVKTPSSSIFSNCTGLKEVVFLSGVTSIGEYEFQSCYALESVTIPSSVKTISAYAFSNCYSLKDITIPSAITSMGANAFYNCYSLESVTIPSTITSIPNNAFYSCDNLKSVTLPNTITSIGESAFRLCSILTTITIPSTVTSIGASAFNGCYGLSEIHFKPTTPPTVANSNAWTFIPTDCKVYVPTGSLSAYTSASNYPSSSTYTYVEE